MLLRNAMWNLLGEGLPMLAALVSIPLLISHIGMERFGALTLMWALLGYMAILDLGLVRSLVQIVAERRGNGAQIPDSAQSDSTQSDSTAAVAGPALRLIAGIGLAAGTLVAMLSGPLTDLLINASGEVAVEARSAILVVAVFVPITLISACLRGILEAHQQFRAINTVRVFVGVTNYLSPLAVLPFSSSLVPVLIAIVIGRGIGLIAFARLCLAISPDLLAPARPASLRPLFSMGGWMMLNNLVGPLMLYADRFILASLLPVATVAAYTTPFEVVVRLLFIPTALTGVLFPVVAGVFRRDLRAVNHMLELGGFAMLAVFLPLLAGAMLFGETALRLWLGAAFAQSSALVLCFLMLGLLLNAVAYVPYALLQGMGRPDVTARLQLVEVPVYLGVLWLMVSRFGPVGAAIAWGLRTGIDLICLLVILARLTPETARTARLLALCAVTVAASGAAGLLLGDRIGNSFIPAAIIAAGLLGSGAVTAGMLWRLYRNRHAA